MSDVGAQSIELYRLADVAEAHGSFRDDSFDGDPTEDAVDRDTQQQAHLRRILGRGERACWRDLARPDRGQIDGLGDLDRRAPHMREATGIVRRHLRAAVAIGRATSLPPMYLLGEPGIGRTWFMTRLARLLGLPVRLHAMNVASLGDNLTGSDPVWRNARPGLVARTLLAERVANPIVVVDEADKPFSRSDEDPYRPLYTLLEPEGSREFVDDFLGFAMDASHVMWVLAGNSLDAMPSPIVDRLTIVAVPAPDETQRRAVIGSVYAEANARNHDFFDPEIADGVADRLAEMTPRHARRALEDGMARAAAEGRRTLRPDDIVATHASRRCRPEFARWTP